VSLAKELSTTVASSFLSAWDPQTLTFLAVGLVVFFATCVVLWILREYVQARFTIAHLGMVIHGVERESLLQHRQDMLNRSATSGNPRVEELWREFDESLVESPSGDELWNTIDADYFFNAGSIARTLVENRIFMAAPAVLTALGVLGTFVGLVIGLSGLQIDTASTDEADITALTAGIEGLIGSAALAFVSSLAGVLASIVVNLLEKGFELSVRGRIQRLQSKIDALFPRHAPEHSLVRIMAASEQSQESLLVLHERIGAQLEATVKGVSEQLQEALIMAIEKAMEPALSRAIDQTAEQSTQVLGTLVEKFGEHFSRLGETQAKKLDEASHGVVAAVEAMAEGVKSQRDQLSEQNEVFRRDLADLAELIAAQRRDVEVVMEQLIGAIGAAADRIDRAGDNLGKAAGELSGSADTMMAASAALGDQFKTSLEKMGELTQQQESAASLFWEYTEKLGALQASLGETTERLSVAADAAGSGLSSMESRLTSFVESLGGRLEGVNSSLATSFSDFEDAMSRQFNEFARESERQLSDRMDEWNKHSRDYAETMLKISQALADNMDELGARDAVTA
jgi:DNA anti-recombination protein RmuC